MIDNRTFLISCVFMLIAFAFVQSTHSGGNVEIVEKNIDKLPYEIAGYKGTDIEMENEVIRELNTDAYLFRRYVDEQGGEITLYIGYYGTKKGGRTGHNPGSCYPGSGWSILTNSKSEICVISDGAEKTIALNRMEVAKGNKSNRLVYHWYQSNRDEVLSNGVQQNLHSFRTRLLYNRNDGAFIRVSSKVIHNIPHTENKMKLFVKEIFPLIVKFWPEEKES